MSYRFEAGGLVVVRVRIQGPRDARTVLFALDTGAERTSIPPAVASAVGIQAGPPQRIATASQLVQVTTGTAARIDSVGLTRRDFPVMIHQLPAGIAFHGLLDRPDWKTETIKAKIVAFHGWDDPMAPPDHVVALGKELTDAGADWQIHAYGNVRHGFTNPNAHQIGLDAVRYDSLAAERSWTSFINLLEEIFAGHG